MAKKKIKVLISLLVVLVLGACEGKNTPAEKVTSTGVYFDVAGFVQAQIALLEKEKPAVIKTVSENQAATEVKKISSVDWPEELETFQELDINKPAFRNAYTATRQQDPTTGLTTLTYRKKPDYDGNVQYLIITLNAEGQVVSLRGLQESHNILLSSRRELELLCHTKNGTARVISYNIKGLQKPIIFSTLHYTIFTKIS